MADKLCNDCGFPDRNRLEWCEGKHPRFTEGEYKRQLIDRAKEVNLSPIVVSIIRGLYYLDPKLNPSAYDLIDLLERKVRNLGNGQRKLRYLKCIEVLSGIPYPRFWEIVKPYSDLVS